MVFRDDRKETEQAAMAVGAASGVAPGQTLIQILPGFAVGMVRLWGCGCVEEQACSRDQARAGAVGLKSEVSDPDETSWQHMEEESLYEVRGLEGEPLRGAALSISIAKGHLTVLEGEEAFVADGDAVGVAAQVAQHLCGTGQRRLGVDDPLPRRRLA
jgi:hypothetical protein